jgi:lipopolysaccharide/colanic/teichoic acid biosynthesis glycosyltransferase
MLVNSAVRGLMSPFQGFLKRGFDVVGAAAVLIVLSPLITLVALTIKLDSHGPVFCRRKFYDLNDALFEAFEFRTAVWNTEDIRSNHANRNHGTTRMGRILRRSGIDEIPHLINVLRGEMSLVGPHPLATASGAAYRARITPDRLRNVRPGIVSWAQVRRGRDGTILSISSRIEDDCYYLANRSFLFDLKILVLVLLLSSTYTF